MSAEERLSQEEETTKKNLQQQQQQQENNNNDDNAYEQEDESRHERVEMRDEGLQTQQRIIHAELGEMTELESMCPKCEENGQTRLMITDIPFFKKIIVSSFHCPHCGEDNTETQFGGEYGPKRTRHHLHAKSASDMGRQIVKSEYATLKIPELELEMPRETQKGSLNTIEGLLVQTIEGLQMEQPVRKVMQPEFAQKIDDFCAKIETYRNGEIPFSVILDDPAGNSFIEPKYDYWHPTVDPQLQLFSFTRTAEERRLIGIPENADEQQQPEISEKQHQDEENQSGDVTNAKAIASAAASRKLMNGNTNALRTKEEEDRLDAGEMNGEVIELDEHCPACHKDSKVKMHPCNIPHFRETIIMAFKCDHCGYKSTEIQTGGAVPEKGRKITLRCETESDLRRDVLKSNTACLIVPELELELVAGTLGGFFTTIEGLLSQIHDSLKATRHTDFTSYGDAVPYEKAAEEAKEPGREVKMQTSMSSWLARLQEAVQGNILPLTIILDDPMSAVYVQNPRAHLPPPEDQDPQLVIEEYTRTYEQDEDLGIHDMVV